LLDAELSGATAALAISRGQEERERALFEQNQIVARPALEAAQLQVQADETRHETALRRLATEWGEPFVQLDAPKRHALITKLLRREMMLLRVELPAGETIATNPPTARITTVGADRNRAAAWFCEAPTVDARTQGRAFLFQAPGPDAALRPGAAVTAFLSQPGPASVGMVIPPAALIRHLGLAWVYLAETDGHFTRHAVTLDRLIGPGWFTTSGLPTGASVVTTGAPLLLSEELKARIAGD
jgi:multidrug efflux pump subunit AcrA (membrane-fusion protein)